MRGAIFCTFMMSLLVYGGIGNCQDAKRNNNWVLGLAPAVNIDFNGQTSINAFNFPALEDCSVISDTNGLLQFFTSGFSVYNKNGTYMDSGFVINSPYGMQLANFYSYRGKNAQTSIILPKKENKYYVITCGMSDSVTNILINNQIYLGYDVLNYSVVDMDVNAGLGKVIEKNKVILDHQAYANCAMTAVRHGNGYDWWLVKADCWKHQFQTFLIKEDTIVGPNYYTFTDTTNYWNYYSEIYFSDDGTKLVSSIQRQQILPIQASYAIDNRAYLYDFDRCTGQFSYRNYYTVPDDTLNFPWEDGNVGVSFSPSGNLLYIINLYSIYQIDVNDTDKHNGIFIHGPDDSLSVFPSYHIGRCAPNGKLYIGNFDGTRNSIGYIDSPNVRGLGCHFMPKGFTQNINNNLLNPPNMPNYGLGGNGLCIPASVHHIDAKEKGMIVYPNPTGNLLHIKNAQGRKKDLYNSVGQLIFSTKEEEIDVSCMAKGLYVLSCDGIVRKVLIE